MPRPTVFVHTNRQQMLGALLSAYSFRKHSRHADRFDVRILTLDDAPHLNRREGRRYLRKGEMAIWHNADLQSFSPLRMLPPQLMGFEGRAVVTDPDVFSVGGDVYELLVCDLGDKAVLARNLPAEKGGGEGSWATSVMVMDCALLADWRWNEQVDAMFDGRLDYKDWIQLRHMNRSRIGDLPEVWNSFDKLEADTRLLHMTERLTQPWKTGLPVDFNMNFQGPAGRMRRWLRDRGWLGAHRRYLPHPDPKQEAFFFGLLKECLDNGEVAEPMLREAIRAHDVRPDAFDLLAKLGYRAKATA